MAGTLWGVTLTEGWGREAVLLEGQSEEGRALPASSPGVGVGGMSLGEAMRGAGWDPAPVWRWVGGQAAGHGDAHSSGVRT